MVRPPLRTATLLVSVPLSLSSLARAENAEVVSPPEIATAVEPEAPLVVPAVESSAAPQPGPTAPVTSAPRLVTASALTPPASSPRSPLEAVGWTVTESMAVSWRGDPGNGDASNADYGTFVSRLNAQASWGDWLLAARLDSAAFASAPLLGDRLSKPSTPDVAGRPVNSADLEGRFVQALVDPRKGVEKLTLRYGGRGLEVTLGDFYANFGRGLVLSLRKVDELGLDTTILGGKVALRSGPLTTTVLAGVTNIQNLDETTSRYSPDPDDALAAARVEYRLPGNAQVGLHGLYGRPSQQRLISATTPDEVRRAGVSLEMPRPLPGLSLYGEYALRADHEADAEHPGHALYASATSTNGPLSLVFEGKAYLGYQPWKATNNAGIKNLLNVVYMAPPTLEITAGLAEASTLTVRLPLGLKG